MAITTDDIKVLRDETGVSIMQCKKALEEAGGDFEKARIILRKLSSNAASKKADRELGAGIVATYLHGEGKIGTMVELLCETDFVAKNEDFKKIAHDIAMQVAATNPEFISSDQINEEAKVKAREIFMDEVKDKPADIQEKIIEGKLASYFGEKTLLDQAFIKNGDITISKLIEEAIQKFGERVQIGRIVRFAPME